MNINLWILIKCIVFKKVLNTIWFDSTGNKLADIQKFSVFCNCKQFKFYCLQWDNDNLFLLIIFFSVLFVLANSTNLLELFLIYSSANVIGGGLLPLQKNRYKAIK